MRVHCPTCLARANSSSEDRNLRRTGRFFRKSDSRWIQRFTCAPCGRSLSHATFNACVRQKKRQLNQLIAAHLNSGMSQRRIAKLLKINRKTVVRKFKFMAEQARVQNAAFNRAQPLAQTMEFDDMETFEHTKCKPISITLAVEAPTRRILGFAVSSMPANGPLAKLSRQKYGKRADDRSKSRKFETSCGEEKFRSIDWQRAYEIDAGVESVEVKLWVGRVGACQINP